eukprot:COSAG01_NODE_16352_length_1243_cov_2.394231_1_plen_234_part_00
MCPIGGLRSCQQILGTVACGSRRCMYPWCYRGCPLCLNLFSASQQSATAHKHSLTHRRCCCIASRAHACVRVGADLTVAQIATSSPGPLRPLQGRGTLGTLRRCGTAVLQGGGRSARSLLRRRCAEAAVVERLERLGRILRQDLSYGEQVTCNLVAPAVARAAAAEAHTSHGHARTRRHTRTHERTRVARARTYMRTHLAHGHRQSDHHPSFSAQPRAIRSETAGHARHQAAV